MSILRRNGWGGEGGVLRQTTKSTADRQTASLQHRVADKIEQHRTNLTKLLQNGAVVDFYLQQSDRTQGQTSKLLRLRDTAQHNTVVSYSFRQHRKAVLTRLSQKYASTCIFRFTSSSKKNQSLQSLRGVLMFRLSNQLHTRTPWQKHKKAQQYSHPYRPFKACKYQIMQLLNLGSLFVVWFVCCLEASLGVLCVPEKALGRDEGGYCNTGRYWYRIDRSTLNMHGIARAQL